MSGFHTRGPVPLGVGVYVSRAFEEEVYRELSANRWVLLLGPRQHGKSSGIARVKARLQDDGYLCATIDLQRIPPFETFEDLVEWWGQRIAGELSIASFEAPSGSSRRDLYAWMEAVLTSSTDPIVVFVDEASGIRRDDWRNSLYGQLRAVANARAGAGAGDWTHRLNFVFTGTFRPESLVSDLNSPFNVCERIDTDDLTLEGAHALWEFGAAGIDDEGIVERAFAFLGGQPYLLQFAFSRVVSSAPGERGNAYESALEDLRNGSDDHLEAVFGKVFTDQRLSSVTARLVNVEGMPHEPANTDFRYLQVLGIAKRSESRLVIRNELYREFVASSSQLDASEPITGPAAGQALKQAQLFPLPLDQFSHFSDLRLAEIAHSAYQGAVEAHRAGGFRLALAGFGCTLEAVLIDFLSSLTPSDLAGAVRRSRPRLDRNENASMPGTLRLVTLLRVAGAVEKIRSSVQVSDPVREWRNEIHPSAALRNYRPERDLEPEARMASALVCALLRDIRVP